MSPELAARLRELIDRDVERRAGSWPPARVWHVRSVAQIHEYYVGEGGELYKLDLTRCAPLVFVDDDAARKLTFAHVADQHPELAGLFSLPMPPRREAPSLSPPGQRVVQRRYRFEQPTRLFHEKYTLDCLESGACRLHVDYYNVVVWAFDWDARGRWTRDGDELQLDLRHAKRPMPDTPTRATLLDDMRIDVHGIGVFAAARPNAT